MTTEENKTEMVEQPKVEEPKAPETAEVKADAKPEAVDSTQVAAELEKTREALKKANKEAAERRKRLEELEAAELKRKEAEMTETERVQAKLKTLEDENLKLSQDKLNFERRELQRKVAKETGLPEGLAERLRGDDEEAMTADAKTILELLPKQEEQKKTPPKIDPTNPANGMKGETIEQKKQRLRNNNTNTVWESGWTADGGTKK